MVIGFAGRVAAGTDKNFAADALGNLRKALDAFRGIEPGVTDAVDVRR